MTRQKKAKNYCKNDEMMDELKHFKKTGEITEKLGKMFLSICNRLTGHSYFRYYDNYMKDELKSAAIVRMVSQIDKFDVDHERPNPFAYFTQTAWNAFVRECTGHYKQKNIKRKIAINYFTKMESSPHYKVDQHLYENMQEMIDDDSGYNKSD